MPQSQPTLHPTNRGIPLDLTWIEDTRVNLSAVLSRVSWLSSHRAVKGASHQAAWLLRAVSLIDLTTLSGDDTPSNVLRLCSKAARPISSPAAEKIPEIPAVTTAAVCVYPARVKDAATAIAKSGNSGKIQVAAVATGFPSGQYDISSRLSEIRKSVEDGATEIDVVINRPAAISGNWREVYEEVRKMRDACGDRAHLKTILATGELNDLTTVARASLVCMMAGADFVKTSTGKEKFNAVMEVGVVMSRMVREYRERTGFVVGFKPAGGVRTAKQAMDWMCMIKEELGAEWLQNGLFRFGASGLLTDLERQLVHCTTGKYANDRYLAMS